MSVTERRVRLVQVGYHMVLDWFTFGVSGFPNKVSIPVIYGIPDGAVVLDVQSDHYRRCFFFLIRHDSFDVVPECSEPPIHKPENLVIINNFVELNREEVVVEDGCVYLRKS